MGSQQSAPPCASTGLVPPVKVRVVTSSEVAKLMSVAPEGTEEQRVYGKVFEEEYTMATYLYRNSKTTKELSRRFSQNIATGLREEGVYSPQRVQAAVKMFSALLQAGVRGRKPRTAFRRLSEGLYLAAQPDLEYRRPQETRARYFEFKTYPLTDYGRAQARAFAWVLQTDIILVGLREAQGEYLVERETVPPSAFVPPAIPAELGIEQEFCALHETPVGRCPTWEKRWSSYRIR